MPGCASGRRPEIHTPQPWLWIPGSREDARPGMTERLRMTAELAAAPARPTLPNPRDAAISAALIRSNRGDLHDNHDFADRALASDAHAGRLRSPLRARQHRPGLMPRSF